MTMGITVICIHLVQVGWGGGVEELLNYHNCGKEAIDHSMHMAFGEFDTDSWWKSSVNCLLLKICYKKLIYQVKIKKDEEKKLTKNMCRTNQGT